MGVTLHFFYEAEPELPSYSEHTFLSHSPLLYYSFLFPDVKNFLAFFAFAPISILFWD